MSATVGSLKFVVDDAGNSRCTFEMVLPSGAVQQSTTDLVGALNILGFAFPTQAPQIAAFATQCATPSSGSTATPTTTTQPTVSAGVTIPGVTVGVKL